MLKPFFAVISLVVFQAGAQAASLDSFQNKNFSPRDSKMCGWHVEVSGNTVILETVPNFFGNGSDSNCYGLNSVMFRCVGLSCVEDDAYICDEDTGETVRDKVQFLEDGNLFYQNNCQERGFKNYRWRW